MSDIFTLKYRDTKPKLLATLKNPDETVHDLTGITDVKLHIRLQTGVVLTRNMTIESPNSAGLVSYSWVPADWDAGNLIIGSHKMEYESVAERLTFPNIEQDNHTLFISADIGQG